MSSLTAEQKQRMEENRRKALEKRALLKKPTASAPSSSSSNTGSTGGMFAPSKSFVNSLSNTNKGYPSSAGSSSSSFANNNKTFDTGQSKPFQPQSNSTVTSSSEVKPSSTGFLGLQQAQKIEENRQKALQKRAQASSASSSNNNNSNINMPISKPTQSSSVSSSFNNNSNGSQPSSRPANDFYKSSSSATNNSNKNQFQSNKTNQGSSFGSKFSSNSGVPSYMKGKQNFFQGNSSGTSSKEEDKINSVLNEFDDVPKPVFGGKSVTGSFRLISRERFVVDVGYHKQVIEIFKTMNTRKYDVETKKWNFCLSEHDALVETLKPMRPEVCISPLPQFVRKTLQAAAKQMPSSCIDLFGLDPKLLDALMPFQHDGVCFGLNLGGRVMIADDMGLGKTIQALGIASYYRREWPLLIVTPSSVRYSWLSAIERWVTSVEPQDITVLNTGKDRIDDSQVVITSYDLLSRRREELLNYNFQVVIMDESHMLKSFKTARYKAAAPIMKKSRRLVLLSGTPALSRPNELYTQISGIDPNLFPRFQDFGVRYCNGKQQHWGWDFSGSSNMEELQIILEARLMIRRLKSDVLSQLPPKQRMMVVLDPSMIKVNSKAMEGAAKQLGLKTLKGVEKHGALLEFFAQSAVAKLKAVSEYLKELLEGDNKFIVFAHHRIMLDKLCETCDNAKVQYIRIDGRTSGDMRQQLVNRFQTNDNVRVAVLSITAANAGITLTAAQLVVFAEVFWNPGILVQAEDRAHRIGQEDSVTVQYLVAKGTVDDHIWPLVQSKLEVLSRAGLSKETSLSGDAKHQKDRHQGTLDKYLEEVIEGEEAPETADDDGTMEKDEDEPQSKKVKL